MKKNLFMSMLAMAGMLFATSCSQDELLNEPTTGDYVNAKFTIGTSDGIATRAIIGNGTKADKVACAVYDENGNELRNLYKVVDVENMRATYEIRLAKGQEYRVAFFAYNSAADAYDVEYLTDIKVKDSQNSNIEDRDAFTAYVDVDATVNAINKDVTLYRPFAQLNLGVDNTEWTDATNAGVEVAKSKIIVTNVYNQFSAYDNAVVATAEPVTMTFEMNTIPTEELEVDVDRDGTIADTEKFKYLALNYLLVGDAGSEKSLTDVEFVWENSDASKTNNPTTHFKNIPVQRNYRTNIIGKLLTNPATFNIVIDAEFQKPDYIVDAPWDGTSVEEPEKDTDGAYVVKTAAEWIWLANHKGSVGAIDINADIKLANSIDFGGAEIGAITFKGTFDGQGNSVRNAVLTDDDDNSTDNSAGLFGNGTAATIKNLNINNIVADVYSAEHGYVGAVMAAVQDGLSVTLENVHVTDANLKGMQGVGGLVGNVVTAGSKLTIKDCSVNDAKIWNYAVEGESGFVCGFVGKVLGTLTFEGNVTSNNVNVIGIYDSDRGEASINASAAKRAESATITGTANTAGVTVTKYPITEGVTYVGSAIEMVNIAKTAKNSANVVLTDNIDMTGIAYSPFNVSSITFDGNNFTISGVVVENNEDASIFGDADNFNIYDLIIKDSKFVATNNTENTEDAAGALLSFVETHSNKDHKLTNCHVVNCTIGSGKYVGGLVGYKDGTYSIELENCSVKESTIVSSFYDDNIYKGHAGGLIGYVSACSITDCTVSNNNFSNAQGNRIGLFIGTAQNDFKPTGIVSGNEGCSSLCGEINKISDTTGVSGL